MSRFRVKVVRADDLLVCELELIGMRILGSAPDRRLVRDGSGVDPVVVVHLPPQHVAEEAIDLNDLPLIWRRVGVSAGSRIAGPSRVAFRIDPAALPVHYKLASILALLNASRLEVPASAARAPSGTPGTCRGAFAILSYTLNPPHLAPPGPAQTALELPFRLILSPESGAGFSHQSEPVPGPPGTRVELWHSLLEPAPDTARQREVRAVWLREGDGPAWTPEQPKWPSPPAPAGDDEPFRLNTMSQRDRSDIVHLSGNRRYAIQTGSRYTVGPVAVRRLALSSLGAWLDSRGAWDPPAAITSLVEWTHRAAQGRDQFVRIVKLGFLYPFGHLAANITISERQFTDLPAGNPPLLFQHKYIIVRQPLKRFEPGAAPARQWHTMPLREVRLRTLLTPNLKEPTDQEGGDTCFIIVPDGATEPLEFKLTGTDAEGNTLDLATPLVWIDSTEAWSPSTIAKAQTLYDGAAGRELAAHGAALALGPSPKGDATFPAEKVTFTAPPQPKRPPPTSSPDDQQPAFWPKLVSADIHAPALQIVAGQGDTARIAYHEVYVANGFGGENRNEIIAQIAGPPPNLDFTDQGDRAGGLIKPSMRVGGLSRQLGPVGGAASNLGAIAAGGFDVKTFFDGPPAELFGVFTLEQVVSQLTTSVPSDLPRIVTEGSGDTLKAVVTWRPIPQSYPMMKSIFKTNDATSMEIDATFDARSPSPGSYVHSALSDFDINLLGDHTFLVLHFDKVEFTTRAGQKTDVNVELGKISFVGPLSFVEEIKKVIPLNGFSDPPALDVTPSGIRSSFSLAVPDLAIGVFSLQNLSLGAGFSIPFTNGALAVSFNFCTRAEPFLLTVSLFGGGGFFALSLDPSGVQVLEAALEFGASVAINLGVAQGGVHVIAGIYFKIESGMGCTLSGYLRLGGNMSVLGLISASIELNLSFTYQAPGKASGRAVVTVEIHLFLFSTSVSVECERVFAGSANDPPFEALMGPYTDDKGEPVKPWREYCEAYA